MTIDEAKEYFGTQELVGKAIYLGKSSITNYKNRGGIPFGYQCELEQCSSGELKARREDDPENVFYMPPGKRVA